MAKSAKPRKRKPQKKNESKRRMKEFLKMNPSQQFLSMHSDLAKLVTDLAQAVDIVSHENNETHHDLIQKAKQDITEARQALVNTFEEHERIQQRKETDEEFNVMDENMAYCTLVPELMNHSLQVQDIFASIQPLFPHE
jgi:hypothetical protein|nr:MAG TPA: hypothetical protein [Caudoviricetes sp.]